MVHLTSWWSPSEARRVIPAPPDVVFAVLADPSTYPDWLLGAQKIRSVDAQWPRPGSVSHHAVGPTDGATVDDISEAVAVDAPRSLRRQVHDGRFRADVDLVVVPVAGASSADVRFREQPAGLARYAMPILRPLIYGRNLTSLERLETRVLHGAPSSPSRRSDS